VSPSPTSLRHRSGEPKVPPSSTHTSAVEKAHTSIAAVSVGAPGAGLQPPVSMSTVYRAWDRERDAHVALKALLSRSGTSASVRLAREAETMVRQGDVAATEAEGRRADEILRGVTRWHLVARGTLADILARRGNFAEALTVASESLAVYPAAGLPGCAASAVRAPAYRSARTSSHSGTPMPGPRSRPFAPACAPRPVPSPTRNSARRLRDPGARPRSRRAMSASVLLRASRSSERGARFEGPFYLREADRLSALEPPRSIRVRRIARPEAEAAAKP
jgi:hypothetical protein